MAQQTNPRAATSTNSPANAPATTPGAEWPTVPTLTTARLILRPIQLADADAVQKTFPRWEIVHFLADKVPWPYPADGALCFIRDVVLSAVAAGKAWHWSIRRKAEPDRLIGAINLTDHPDDNRGFWLDPAWQGRGLMTEACDAATEYWFETLDRPVLRVPKAVANIASRRISERSGMRVGETIEKDYVGGRYTSEMWEITRNEWRARRR